MKYFIITFGCGANLADSERIEQRLKTQGHKKSTNAKLADLIIINACSVRQSAIDRVYGQIRQFKNKKIILAGCLLEKDKKKFKNKVTEIWHPDKYFDLKPIYSNPISASVPIMTGCNNFCTYCAVPFTRGREKSRPAQEIINEAKKIINPPAGEGRKEIWLLGQNVNSYKSGQTDFPELLKKINAISGKFWIRFISPHPKDFSNELIKTIAMGEKITKYINLPVQSGDNEILKKMNRQYSVQEYIKLVNKIRKIIPKVGLSTDTIVGFPGETRQQFLNTIKLYKKIKFDMAFIAEYSARPGTAATLTMEDNVTPSEKEKRRKELNKILTKTALENNKKLLGQTLEILIDSEKNGLFYGRTNTNKIVQLPQVNPPLAIGQFVKVKITEAGAWKLKGVLQKPKIIVVLGPTASGKSDLAVKLALKIKGEIISADSRQVYRGMNIGSGKITKTERQGVKHYLLDVADPKTIFSAANFKELAEKTVAEIIKKEKVPIICGGTGFYIHTLLGNSQMPKVAPDWSLRKKLEKKTTEELFKMLKKTDPKRALNIDSKNKRRLIRAIEIAKKNINLTSSQDVKFEILWLGIKKDKKELEKIINKRTDQMIKNGLESEVKKLVKKYGWTTTLKNTIGYAEWQKENPIEKIKLHTFQYAKRQMTWYKKYPSTTLRAGTKKVRWVKNKNQALKLAKQFLK